MSTVLANHLREVVAAFVHQEIALGDLRRRVVPEIYTLSASDDPAVMELADDVILYLAEADHGDWTEDELRQALGRLPALQSPATTTRGR